MPKPRRSFDLRAFCPLLDKSILTEIEAKDDAEAAIYRRLVLAKVGVRLHRRLHIAKEYHELIMSLVN